MTVNWGWEVSFHFDHSQGHWQEASVSPQQLVGWFSSLLPEPLRVAWALTKCEREWWRKREKARWKMWCLLGPSLRSHHYCHYCCHVLFIRSLSLCLDLAPGKKKQALHYTGRVIKSIMDIFLNDQTIKKQDSSYPKVIPWKNLCLIHKGLGFPHRWNYSTEYMTIW